MDRSTGHLSLAVLIPGILIAATGVGAGDLAAAAFAGSKLGVAVLWAVALGAFIKYVITEGLARWQLATGQTLLEGAIYRLGKPAQYFFISYFVVWTFGVGSSLMSACGVAAHALFPVFADPETGKVVFGLIHTVLGLALVLLGSYRTFSGIMSMCVGLMFILVVTTALLIPVGWGNMMQGLFIPTIPTYIENGTDQGVGWTFALMGGVGGTLTILSYGYWIREEGREGAASLSLVRLDLGVAYLITAIFGIAVVIIASVSDLERQASSLLVVTLADQLGDAVGSYGRLVFLIGAWAAMFSSMLGVWQSVPYMFADYMKISKAVKEGRGGEVVRDKIDTRGRHYRIYLVIIATVPAIGLFYDFELVQKLNSIYGALVMPMIALAVLLLNGRESWVGGLKNRPMTAVFLIGVLGFFLVTGVPALVRALGG